ncbi:hypothetical protein ACFWMG_33555 [Streptomyces sp. NPDC127074]|uniref:hypothetical protein n=1 Tax=Streptomyces sp. NPDC127074 TaxID=3347130 RepID=UPI0036615B00
MTTALSIEADPYILPLPEPDSPVVMERWISADNTRPNSLYSDDIWSLGPLTDNPGDSIQWMKFARWLDRQGVSQLSDCTTEHWKAYAAKSASGCTRGHALTILR